MLTDSKVYSLYIDNTYLEEGFKVIVENNLFVLMKSSVDEVSITPAEAYKYEYDLLGLLKYKRVPYHLHWIVMRINGILNPFTNIKELRGLLLPNEEVLKMMMSHYKQRRSY